MLNPKRFMSLVNPLRAPQTWKQLAVAAVISLVGGVLCPAFAQGPNFETKISRLNRSPNPRTDLNRTSSKRPDNRTPKASPEAEKLGAIEKAIDAGNKARDGNDYQEALIQYEKAKTLKATEARAHYGLGNVYFDLNCYDSAIGAYLRAIRFNNVFREARIALGSSYSRKERYEDAEIQFRSVLKDFPNDAEANIGLGLLFAEREKYREAIDQIRIVLDNQSLEKKDHGLAYLALGIVHRRQEQYQLAIGHFQSSIRANPDLVAAYLWLGSSQLSFGNAKLSCVVKLGARDLEALRASAQQATGHIEKAREIAISKGHDYSPPSLYLLLALGLTYQQKYDVALAQLKTYFERVNELERQGQFAQGCNTGLDELKAKGHYQVGYVYQFQSKFEPDSSKKKELLEKAMNSAEQALKAKPDYAVAHFMLGNIYHSENKNEDAIKEYTKALVPGFPLGIKAALYYLIGMEHLALGRKDEALKHYEEAIKRDPNEPSFYEAAASIYIGQGDLDATFSHMNTAINLREKVKECAKPDPYYYFGATYTVRFLKSGSEEAFEAAIKWLTKATEISPEYSDAYRALGLVYLRHRNADEALANYDKAIKYNPKDSRNYSDKAQVYLDLKENNGAAIENLKQAISLKPDYAEAYYQLGIVYRLMNDDAEAIKQLLNAINYDAKFLNAYLELAAAYRGQNNFSESLKYLNKAMVFAQTDFRLKKEFAKLYEAQGQNESAVGYYTEALKLLKSEDAFVKELYLCRIERLQGRYAEAISCFQKIKLPQSEDPGQIIYDVGLAHVASRNKVAAHAQYEQLKGIKSLLAHDLLRQINKMK